MMREINRQLTAAVVAALLIEASGARAATSAESNIITVDTRGSSGAWAIRAWADKDGNGVYDAGEALVGAEVYYGGRTASHLKGTTDSNGLITVFDGINANSEIFVRKVIHTEPAVKSGHEVVDNTMYTLWLDSDGDDTVTDSSMSFEGTWTPRKVRSEDVTAAEIGQPVNVRLRHPIFEWNLMVGAEVSSETFVTQLKFGLRGASAYLFDATDGQMKLGKVGIVTNVVVGSASWKNSDIVIFNEGEYWPNAHVNGIRNGGGLFNWFDRHAHFGTTWGGEAPDGASYFRTIIHEFGHYGLDLYDEYKDGRGSKKAWKKYRDDHWDEVPKNYGIMDYQYSSDEFSSSNDYLSAYSGMLGWNAEKRTQQLEKHSLYWGGGFHPAWQWIEEQFTKTYGGIPVDIIVPPVGVYEGNDKRSSEDRAGPSMIPQPYTACEFPSSAAGSGSPVGSVLSAIATTSQAAGPLWIQVTVDGAAAPGASILKKSVIGPAVSFLGRANRNGQLLAFDIAEGDTLVARHDGLEGAKVIGSGDLAGPIRITIRLPGTTKSLVEAQPPPSDALGIVVSGAVLTGPTNELLLRLLASESLSASPTVTIHLEGGAGVPMTLLACGGNAYTGILAIASAGGGSVEISCDSVSGEHLSTTDIFSLDLMSATNAAEIYSRDGWTHVAIPPETVPTDAAAIIYSCHAPTIIPAGFTKIPVGPAISVTLGAGTVLAGGTGVVNITYREADLVGVDETTIRMYRWDEAGTTWNLLDSGVSVDRNVCSALVSNFGVMALFADGTADSTPPSAVGDLAAQTGTNGWMVEFSWTSPGDDGVAGQAVAYVMRFSTSAISEATWDASPALSLGIVPAIAGTGERAAVQMPDPGTYYYFALRAQDEVGNLGPISNIAEARSHENDTDSDGMPDQWEATYSLSPTNSVDGALDGDNDGLTNLQEREIGTNPTLWDTDGDGMADGWETQNMLNPLDGTDASLDADGDGLSNMQERLASTDPNSGDTDGDGMQDKWELDNGLVPFTASGINGGDADPDGDMMPNRQEFAADTCATNRLSLLAITDVSMVGGSLRLGWRGGVRATQFVERCGVLGASNESWVAVFTNQPPTTTATNMVDSGMTNRAMFYRIRTVR